MTTSAKSALTLVFNIIVGAAALKMALATIARPMGKQHLPNLDDVEREYEDDDQSVDYEALL